MSNWVTPFLEALRREGVPARAARAVGISSATAYALKAKDADFAEAYRLAIEDAMDDVEHALREEATGVDELVVHQGQLTPVFERDANGQIVHEEYEVEEPIYGKRGANKGKQIGVDKRKALRPKQARLANGSLQWLTVRKRSVPAAIAMLKGRRKQVFADRTEVTGADGGPVQMDATARRARIASILAAAKDREGLA